MTRFIILELYKTLLITKEENNKFELYTDNFDEFSFAGLKDELEEILSISDFSPKYLQQEIIGSRIIQAYVKLRSEKSSTDGYHILFMDYARSPFRDFESYLRVLVDLDKKNIQLILKQNFSHSTTYEILQGIVKDFSEVVYTMGDHEGTVQIENDDISMKTKPIWLVLD